MEYMRPCSEIYEARQLIILGMAVESMRPDSGLYEARQWNI